MATNPSGTAEYKFDLSGGRTCLDFVNTVSGDRGATPRERLGSYATLVAWARQSGAVGETQARHLLAEARRRPADAEGVLAEALALREALYRIFLATAEKRPAPTDDLSLLSTFLSRSLGRRHLERREGGYVLAWDEPPDALDAPLWRVAASAAELLSSAADLDRVRVCGLHETHECSWLFIDATRARTRRWCSMQDCGNRAKARRHYARTRAE